ncbi:hypothetical protein [Paraburkholderia strydomiana]|uniref:hypothetical protein n=1 Tax=Paraburkholderia strydomiana TaxID=1245417 RepID=UPI00285C2AF5|nr:hypothetical protein [Paraburkholderia strydomiana]MDR7006451.1 hypothetical protein [Paraburkholderia strydomiana]
MRNILAPHRKACQCLFPILPQCDSFLIIVFPVSPDVIFGHMSNAWLICKKARVLRRFNHIYEAQHNAESPLLYRLDQVPAAQQKA